MQKVGPFDLNEIHTSADEKAKYEKMQSEYTKTVNRMQEQTDYISSSTKKLEPIHVDSDTAYLIDLSDVHTPKGTSNLIETLRLLKKIPNLFIGINGDVIQNSIKTSVGDTHAEIIDPQAQIKMISSIIKEADCNGDVLNRIVYITTGNHCERTIKAASMDPAYLLACELGIQERYVENVAELTMLLQDPDNPTKEVQTTGDIEHGESLPGNPGAQADAGFQSTRNQTANFVVYSHNHKISIASENKDFYSPIFKKIIQHSKTYVNFGSYMANDKYADRAGYSYPRVSDKEILRIKAVNGKPVLDMINYRSMINDAAENNLAYVEKTLDKLSNKKFTNMEQLDKSFYSTTKRLYKTCVQKYNDEMQEKQEIHKKSGINDKLYLVLLNGLLIGSENTKTNEKIINDAVKTLKKLNGSCMVLINGDAIHYKKAFTLTNKNGNLLGEKFPEESFSEIELLAQLLKPLKNKILVYNSGKEEEKIMKYQSEALAKMAMNRLQMDESLCYEPYNELKLQAEKLKIQAMKVEKYNKNILNKAVNKAYVDLAGEISEALPYYIKDYNALDDGKKDEVMRKTLEAFKKLPSGFYRKTQEYNDERKKRLDFLKSILASKLRAEKEFFDLVEDTEAINYKFPLEEIELRKPNENLIQNIFCKFCGIDPNKITINPNPGSPSLSTMRLRDNENTIRTISLIGSSSDSKAQRKSTYNMLIQKNKSIPGANIYYTNTKLGKEFMTLGKSVFNDVDGKSYIYDTIYVSGGSFANGENNESVNKIIKLTATTNKKENVPSSGMYYNSERPYNLYGESLNYETVLLEEDVFLQSLEKIALNYYEKTVKEFQKQQVVLERKESLDKFRDALFVKKLEECRNLKKSQKQKQTSPKTNEDNKENVENINDGTLS